jgi:hypothetical protein
MTRRLLLSYLSITALVLVVLEVPLGVTFARSERRQLTEAVRHDAFALVLLAEETVESRAPGDLDGLVASYRSATGGRATIVDARGARLADSAPSEGENFANRPEIQAALAGREAVGVRYSRTLDQRLLYVAEPVASAGRGPWRGPHHLSGDVRRAAHPADLAAARRHRGRRARRRPAGQPLAGPVNGQAVA